MFHFSPMVVTASPCSLFPGPPESSRCFVESWSYLMGRFSERLRLGNYRYLWRRLSHRPCGAVHNCGPRDCGSTWVGAPSQDRHVGLERGFLIWTIKVVFQSGFTRRVAVLNEKIPAPSSLSVSTFNRKSLSCLPINTYPFLFFHIPSSFPHSSLYLHPFS